MLLARSAVPLERNWALSLVPRAAVQLAAGWAEQLFEFYEKKGKDGQLDDSVETPPNDAVVFEHRTWTGHQDYEDRKRKRQPVLVGVS